MNDLILGALNLTIFGMGFVFIFLTLLVFITKFMSHIVNKQSTQAQEEVTPTHNDSALLTDSDVDEEAKFVIQQAIKMHTGA